MLERIPEGMPMRMMHGMAASTAPPEDAVTPDKVLMNRLRRAARRQRLTLHKSPRRDPRAADYGLWMIEGGPGRRPTRFTPTIEEVARRLGVPLDDEGHR